MAVINTVIAPTILAANKDQFTAFVNAYKGFAKRVQIDITDGQFAPTLTLPVADCTGLVPAEWTVDYHMMVASPSTHVDEVIKQKPSLVIFHVEAGEDLTPTFQKLKAAGIKAGVAIMKQTFPGAVAASIKAADHVLIFGGELGRQGGKADMLQVEKIPLVKAINPEAEIGWDGGANMKNARALAHAGVDVIYVGSAIAASTNPQEMYEKLVGDLDKKGVVI